MPTAAGTTVARIQPMGDEALLVDLDGVAPAVVADALGRARLPGVLEVVPAAVTVLVRTGPRTDLAGLAAAVRALAAACETSPAPRPGDDTGVLELPVTYDGGDLDDVAAHTGLSRQEVVAAHTGQLWTVAFCGFAPGFAYLEGSDHRLDVPRRPDPRTRVPGGAVGLAGRYSGVYPRSSPGGWQLIGRTDATIWDLDRDPPGLLRPGVRVRFVDAGGNSG